MTSTKELIAGLRSHRLEGDIAFGVLMDEAADRLEALAAPVEGVETPRHIAGMRAEFEARKVNGDHRISALWEEVDRLSCALAAKEAERLHQWREFSDKVVELTRDLAAERDQRSRSDDTVQELGLRLREEQKRNERLAGSLRDINRRAEDQNIDHVDFRVGARHVTDAALSQEKQS